MALLGDVNGTQLSELAEFRIDLDLLGYGTIVGRGRLDFRVGQSADCRSLLLPEPTYRRRCVSHPSAFLQQARVSAPLTDSNSLVQLLIFITGQHFRAILNSARPD